MSENEYMCEFCGELFSEDDMYETGYNHDAMCWECKYEADAERDRYEQEHPGRTYVWFGDQKHYYQK